MHYKKIFLFILLSFLIVFNGLAQRAEVGIVAGGAGYIGDLNQNNPLKISGITAGVFAKINFTPFVGLGLHYNYGNIKGDDLKSSNQQFKDRGLNFNTNINEVSLITDINFLDVFSPISKRSFTPYVFVGIGGVLFKTKAEYLGVKYNDLRLNQTEGQSQPYRPYAITVPYGAGIKYRLTDNLTLSSQIGYRTTFTDYLDDVSGKYTGYGAPDNPSLVVGVGGPGSQRGDFRKRDTYMFVSVGISYTFVSQKCFTF